MKLTSKSKWAAMISMILVGAALTGCGKQAFDVSESQSALQSPGTYIIPPKVDVLVAMDDTGSSGTIRSQINAQFPSFLKTLDDSRWDYRFASIPLTRDRNIAQIVPAKYDSNWGAEWTPAFPGASSSSGVLSSLFRKPGNYSDFASIAINNSSNGLEPGLETILKSLNASSSANFLRPDAMLVVLVLSNGEDTSRVNYCYDRGYAMPCNDGSYQNSLNFFVSQLKAQKDSAAKVKFYANVPVGQSDCTNRFPSDGNRYSKVAAELGGASFDICKQSLTTTLATLSQDLKAQRLNFVTSYLFIAQDANPDTIQVTKYSGGATIQIPHDSVNGWSYLGYQSDVYAIDSPVLMNRTSGYTIRLNGSAKLVGNDTADVKFKPAGAVASH
ncbi:MAG: hypothetical protein H7222_18505 [Methylotenera sp.]|nr:hypothetical protein [Oligoflexia bacterium]